MTQERFVYWLLYATPWVLVFIGRNWIKAWIEKGLQHNFDRKLEMLRAELRQSEEAHKSNLRTAENELSSLRQAVLSGSAARQTLLDQRRFEAVGKIWGDVNDLSQFKLIARMMAKMNYDEMAKDVRDPRMRKVVDLIEKMGPTIDKLKKYEARDEQPFVPDLAWAYYSAYKSILMGTYIRLMMLKAELDDAPKFFKEGPTKDILKAALPHQAKFIDEGSPEDYYFLLDEIEQSLLAELRRILEGDEADASSVEKARRIRDAVGRADAIEGQQGPLGAM